MCQQCLMCFLEDLSGQMPKKCNAAFLETRPLSLLVNGNECRTHVLAYLCHLLKRRRRSGLCCMKWTGQKSRIHFAGLWRTQSKKHRWILCCRHERVTVRYLVCKCGRWRCSVHDPGAGTDLSPFLCLHWFNPGELLCLPTCMWHILELRLTLTLRFYRLESFKCQESVFPMTGLADVHLLYDPKHSLKKF